MSNQPTWEMILSLDTEIEQQQRKITAQHEEIAYLKEQLDSWKERYEEPVGLVCPRCGIFVWLKHVPDTAPYCSPECKDAHPREILALTVFTDNSENS